MSPLLRASFAPIWGRCSGALSLCENEPNFPTQESAIGTAAHWVLSEVLTNHKHSFPKGLVAKAYLGRKAPNDEIIDDSVVEGVQIELDEILKVAERHNAVPSLLIEQPLKITTLHPDLTGTPDVALILPGFIYLWDYKHGHRDRQAINDLQLVCYLMGLAEQYRLPETTSFLARIVQPFCYHGEDSTKTWTGHLAALRPLAESLSFKAHHAFTDASLSTGKHCRDCPAVYHCSAARKMSYNLIDVVNAPVEIDEMDDYNLGIEYRLLKDNLPVIAERLDALAMQIESCVKKGSTKTGFGLKAKQSRRKWTINSDLAVTMAKQWGYDISKPGVLTPAQAVKVASKEDKALFENFIKSISARETKGVTLVEEEHTLGHRAFRSEE